MSPASQRPAAPPSSSTEPVERGDVKHARHAKSGLAALTLGALGVVFGDIGTSPLYAMQTAFSADNHIVRPDQASVYGVISLVVWTIVLVVCVKYVTIVMRADNDGEGGIMSLIALVQRSSLSGSLTKATLVVVGIVGASLFYGDGMITPAISVLSAVEGLKVAAPSLESFVIPVTVVILAMLFAIQRLGTGVVGRLFGPIMGLWFAIIAAAGLGQIISRPDILAALSPSYAITFLAENTGVAFIALASVVLVVTGAEALYADMGHFGRRPIRRAWFFVVFPALTLNYLGQGSLILHSPQSIDSPFFLLLPHWSRLPMVFVATAATVIASQALISGAFSITTQAVQLGFLPRVHVRHTSEHEVGQVFVSAVNWLLFAGVVAIVVGFGSSAKLASAYGVAVTGTFVVTTILFLVIARVRWRKPVWMIAAAALVFLAVDLAFFSANLRKIPDGGWLPISIAVVVFTVLMTWQRGHQIVTRNRREEEGSLRDFIQEIHAMEPAIHRVAGTAVFLNATIETTPLALRANVEHNHTLHQSVVILCVKTLRVPHVPQDKRLTIDHLSYGNDGITHVTAEFGFQDEPDVPATLRLAAEEGLEGPADISHCSYFLSRISIHATHAPGMRMWRKRLFVAISRHAASPVEYFRLPADRTVTTGGQIDI